MKPPRYLRHRHKERGKRGARLLAAYVLEQDALYREMSAAWEKFIVDLMAETAKHGGLKAEIRWEDSKP